MSLLFKASIFLIFSLSLSQEAFALLNQISGKSSGEGSIAYDTSFKLDEIGVNVDIASRTITHRVVDLRAEGNSGTLPIIVSRIHDMYKSQPSLRVPFNMGNWALEVPRITAYRGLHRSDGREFSWNDSPDVWSRGFCHNPVYTRKNTSVAYALGFWDGLSLEIPGNSTRKLIFKNQGTTENDIVYPNVNIISGIKGNVTYVTTDNWKADCINLYDSNDRSGFEVKSPNGLTYTFDRFASPKSKINQSYGWPDTLGAFIYASKVTDIHGNTLNYSYVSDANGQLHVDNITSSDGRIVRFYYDEMDLSNHLFWRPQNSVKILKSVSLRSQDDSTDLKKIFYEYTNETEPDIISWLAYEKDSSTCSNNVCRYKLSTKTTNKDYKQKGLLKTVILNDGKEYNYGYKDPMDDFSYNHRTDYYQCDTLYVTNRTLGWQCGSTFSTIPVFISTVKSPMGTEYQINRKTHSKSPCYDLSDRCYNLNGSTASPRVASITVRSSNLYDSTQTYTPIKTWKYEFLEGRYLPSTYNSENYAAGRELSLSADSVAHSYFAKVPDYGYTTIVYPGKKREIYIFNRSRITSGDWTNLLRFSDNKGGTLAAKIIGEVDSSGTIHDIYSAEFKWDVGKLLGDDLSVCWLKKCDKPSMYRKSLTKKIIKKDGFEFITEFHDHDQYGNSQRTVEYSSTQTDNIGQPVAQQKRYKYFNDEQLWLIGLLEEEAVYESIGLSGLSNKWSDILGKIIINRDQYTGDLLSYTYFGTTKYYEYNLDGTVKREYVKDEDGNDLSRWFYDYKYGTPTREVDGEGNEEVRVVNQEGKIISVKNELNQETHFSYNDSDLVDKITFPGVNPITTDWHESKNLTIYKSQGSSDVISTTDSLGRLLSITKKDDESRFFSNSVYDTDYEGRKIFESFPSKENLSLMPEVSSLNPDYSQVFSSFNISVVPETLDKLKAHPNKNEILNALEGIPKYLVSSPSYPNGILRTYDSLDRLLTERNNINGNLYQYCYGPECNTGREGKPMVKYGYITVDPLGFETIYNYQAYGDPSDMLLKEVVTQVSLNPVEYNTLTINYNEFGNVTSIKQGQHERLYVYNKKLQLEKIYNPENGWTNLSYYPYGLEKAVTLPNGNIKTITYDKNLRVSNYSYNNGDSFSITNHYTKTGNLRSVETPEVRTIYNYNGYDQLTSVETIFKDSDKKLTLGYEYDENGNIQTINYPDGLTLNYVNDGFGKNISAYGDGKYLASSANYNSWGQVEELAYGNQITKKLSFDLLGAPKNLKFINSVNQKILDLTYNYDKARNIESVKDNLTDYRSKKMKYDGLSQLISASGSWGKIDYEYDEIGNIDRISQSGSESDYRYDSSNRLTGIGNEYLFTYDNLGNVKSDGHLNYVYNNENMLKSVSSGIDSKFYEYDGNLNKVYEKDSEGKSTYFLYDQSNKLMYSTNGYQTGGSSSFVFFGGKLLARLDCNSKDRDDDSDGVPDCMEIRLGTPTNLANNFDDFDFDNDGVINSQDVDVDGDGIPNRWESQYGLNHYLASDANLDFDDDGVMNLQEFKSGSNPLNKDTDNDGVSDYVEIYIDNTDPNLNLGVMVIIINSTLF